MSAYTRINMKEEDETCSEQDEEEEDELFSMPQATIVKPLMSPRKRTIQLPEQPYGKKRYYLHRQAVAKSIIYLILLISLLIGMAFLSLQLIKVLTEKNVLNGSHGDQGTDDVKIIGCTEFEVEEVWSHTLHQLLTETAFRLNDVNQDGTPDVIMGFATGADRYFAEPILCDLYFDGFHPCLGGLLALDGKTGDELWRHYTEHEVFAVNCNVDIDSDGVRDCLGGGRAGVFHAVSGATGALLWRFDEHEAKVDISNLYTPQFIRDMNGDGVQDVLAMHGGDPLRDPGKPVEKIGRLIFFSGFTGDILQWVQVPDKLESYYSPQVYYNKHGEEMVLFGTGGETHGGSLWSISLEDLYEGHIHKAQELYRDDFKGVMTPPVLIDITGDGVIDIVMAMYNSTVVAINGDTYDYIWSFSMPWSESYSTPAPGFYNQDNVPDFMIKYAYGPGFPIYYYSQSTIIDGKTGKALLTPYIKDTVGSQNSPLTISVDGYGNDIYLYWINDCEHHHGEGDEFTFVKGTNVHEQSRSDFCKLRYNSKEFIRMYMMDRENGPPGHVVYDSRGRWDLEHKDIVNTSAMALEYVQSHPEFRSTYEKHMKHEQFWKETALKRQKIIDSNIEKGISDIRMKPELTEASRKQSSSDKIGVDMGKILQDTESKKDVGVGREHELLENSQDDLYERARQILYKQYRPIVAKYPSIDTWQNTRSDGGNPSTVKWLFNSVTDTYPVEETAYDYSQWATTLDYNDEIEYQIPTVNQGLSGHDRQWHTNPSMSDQSWHTNPSRHHTPTNNPSVYQKTRYQYDDNLMATGYQPRYHTPSGYQFPTGHQKPLVHNIQKGFKIPSEPHRTMENQDKQNTYQRQSTNVPLETTKWQQKNKLNGDFWKQLRDQKINEDDISRPNEKKYNGRWNTGSTKAKRSDEILNKRFMGVKDTLFHNGERVNKNADSEKNLNSGINVVDEPMNMANDQIDAEQLLELITQRIQEIESKASIQNESKQGCKGNSCNEHKNNEVTQKTDNKRMRKRHVGPHDEGGLQRLLSTGTLAPVLNSSSPDARHSIDVIFATYWFYPAKTRVILPDEQKCIDDKMADEVERFDPTSPFYGYDHDAYEESVMDDCLNEDSDDHGIYESQTNYNPFNIHMGQMTVYRMKLKCKCKTNDPRLQDAHYKCSRILPFEQQEWAAYMGTYGNSYFNPRNKHQPKNEV